MEEGPWLVLLASFVFSVKASALPHPLLSTVLCLAFTLHSMNLLLPMPPTSKWPHSRSLLWPYLA